MPKGEVYHRLEYGEWIASVRKMNELTTKEFGEKLVRFRDDAGKLKLVRYTKGSVSNWEKGEHLPAYPETVASIAMLDYDKRMEKGEKLTQSRYAFVLEHMSYYLNKTLYCKNILDLLIFQSVRGLLKLEEVPEVREIILQMLLEDDEEISEEDTRRYAVSRDTNTLFNVLLQQETLEELLIQIRKFRHYYAIGYRALGVRIQNLYQKSYENRYHLDFVSAVGIYAPVYRVSFRNTSHKQLDVSRKWLIDFALQLHFNRDEINSILSDAQYSELSESEENAESLIVPYKDMAFGTIGWYERIEENYKEFIRGTKNNGEENGFLEDSDFIPLKFWRITKFSMKQKLIYAYSIGIYMALHKLDMPLPFYLLDFIPGLQKAGSLWKKYEHTPTDAWSNEWEILKKASYKKTLMTAELVQFVENSLKETEGIASKPENAVGVVNYSLDMNDEYVSYLEVPERKIRNMMESLSVQEKNQFAVSAAYQDLCACYSFTALLYSLMTGYIFKGDVDPDEVNHMISDASNENQKKARKFLEFLFRMFLGGEPLLIDEKGFFYLKDDSEKGRKMKFLLILNYLVLYMDTMK